MKCIFIFVLYFYSFTSLAEEQHLSVFASYNLSNVNFSFETRSQYYTTNNKPHSSMNYGFLFEYDLKSLWSVETGIIYLERGFQSPINPSSSSKRDYDEYFWSGFYLPVEGRFRPSKVFTGFIGGYIFDGIGQMSFLSSTTQTPTKLKFSDQGFKTVDWGLTYGAGINIQINNQTDLLIEIRFNEGLAEIVEPSNQNIGVGTKATNKETMLSLGVLI